MRKLKIVLITSAVVISIGGAFATSKQGSCVYATNYHLVSGGGYQPVGVLGVDYFCWNRPGTCTYYKPNPGVETYVPCRSGQYDVIPHLKSK